MKNYSIQQIFETIPKRFKAEKSTYDHAIFHFDFGTEKFSVIINKDNCTIEPELVGKSVCEVKTTAETYINIETGNANAQMAMFTGKLKVSNVNEMMRFAKLFRKFKPEYLEEKAELNTNTEIHYLDRTPSHGPLKYLRVLDFTRLLPGPICTMLMADMGAEVIKIEDPDDVDYARNFPPFIGDESANYIAGNRSKRNIAINYSNEKGKQIIYKLIKKVDILVEQFRPGYMARMGLGYEDLKKINPRLIYVSITGYGQSGPYAQKAGHDINFVGYNGILGVTGNRDGKPALSGAQIADIAGGSYMAVIACLSALYARDRQGVGQHVDVSMTDASLPLMALPLNHYWANKEKPEIGKLFLSGGLSNYNVYECNDGKFIALGCMEPKFWSKFCEIVGKSDWSERIVDHRESNQESLYHDLSILIKTKTRDEWNSLCYDADICVSPILEIDEIEKNEHIVKRDMIVTTDGEKNIGVPLKFSETNAKPSWKSPELGADTSSILKELGLENEIESLISTGIIVCK